MTNLRSILNRLEMHLSSYREQPNDYDRSDILAIVDVLDTIAGNDDGYRSLCYYFEPEMFDICVSHD